MKVNRQGVCDFAKKLYKKIGIMVLSLLVAFIGVGCDVEDTEDTPYTYAEDLGEIRAPYTTLKENGQDQVTLMIYLVGSDLESEGGFATADLEEIMAATMSNKVNIIIQTGGAKAWQDYGITADTMTRYAVTDEGLAFIEDVGEGSMADAETLTDFIQFAATTYPADRYQLVFWNHGGGTLAGFGYDECYDEMLSLVDIDTALTKADVKFDFVGFDACLMATIETAMMLEKHSDYLIASEETEPGGGWYYTNWISKLSDNTAIPTVELGKIIVDDFVEESDWYEDTTLSIIDLREIPGVYEKLCDYMNTSKEELIYEKNYTNFASARAKARDYGEGQYEQIDIIDYIEKTDLGESENLIKSIESAVKYADGSMSDSYGMAMYYPYLDITQYSDMRQMMDGLGMDEDYTGFFDTFTCITAGGQKYNGESVSPIASLTGQPEEEIDYEQYEWYDTQLIEDYSDTYEDAYNELSIVEKDDDFVLELSDEEWENIVGIELQVWLDDGEGYLDLGSDNVYEFDEEGNLLVTYDGYWVAIEGQIVPFYKEASEYEESGKWFVYGYVPCLINGEEKELLLCWSDEVEEGYVAGYRQVSGLAEPAAKGLISLREGDEITTIVDYYTYDGDYEASYEFNEPIVYEGQPLEVSYEDVGEYTYLVYYMLTDIYQNNYWTEALEVY